MRGITTDILTSSLRKGVFQRIPVIAAAVFFLAGGCPASAAPGEAAESPSKDYWTASSRAFKAQLHALAAQALMLQLKSPPPAHAMPLADRRMLQDAKARLSDSLRSINALLSMLEIADHSDRGDRVRQILALWLQSSRISLQDNLKNAGKMTTSSSVNSDAAAFIEELKIIWQRLDNAYSLLEAQVG